MHSEDRLRYYKALLTWSNQFDEYFDVGYVYEWQRYEGYRAPRTIQTADTAVRLFSLCAIITIVSDKLDSEFGFDYFAQCWGSQLSIETRGASNGRKSETIFNYKFYLKGLGNSPKRHPGINRNECKSLFCRSASQPCPHYVG